MFNSLKTFVMRRNKKVSSQPPPAGRPPDQSGKKKALLPDWHPDDPTLQTCPSTDMNVSIPEPKEDPRTKRKHSFQLPSSSKRRGLSRDSGSGVSGSASSLVSMASDASGVISDNIVTPSSPPPSVQLLATNTDTHSNTPHTSSDQPPVRPTQGCTDSSKHPTTSARVDLSMRSLTDIPPHTRQILLTSSNPTVPITKVNPISLKDAIDSLCGPVDGVEYLRSGGIILTAKTLDQVRILLSAKSLPPCAPTIETSVAWSRQFSYGKIWAPEFSNDSLTDLLDYLKEYHVIAIRKLLRDPKRSNVPLYVLTFLGPAPPSLTLGYINYRIDKYYPSPLRCRNCWRLRHSTTHCRSKPACKNCTSTSHTSDNCSSPHKCINCGGPHGSSSTACPEYIREQYICNLQADSNISFSEARSQVPKPTHHPSQPQQAPPPPSMLGRTVVSSPPLTLAPPPPDINSAGEFPPLSQRDEPSVSQPIAPMSQLFSLSSATSTQLPPHQPPPSPSSPNNLTRYLSQLSLPPLSPLPPQPPPPPSHYQPGSSSIPSTHHSSSFVPSQGSPMLNLLPFSGLITKLLPPFIKLLFATELTDRIQSLIELGTVLGLDTVVADALSSLDLSSNNPK